MILIHHKHSILTVISIHMYIFTFMCAYVVSTATIKTGLMSVEWQTKFTCMYNICMYIIYYVNGRNIEKCFNSLSKFSI